ncbi:MAG: valine--tRNA ligase [Candidatus Pacebacteria bacterium]|nr:valine--tRNA ligase [Candidatus Paceibacterota bacterium]
MKIRDYDAAAVEAEITSAWDRAGIFKTNSHSTKPRYTIIMPPPNVTGSLHVGHALTFSLQDILIRYHRARGFEVLWQAGTDHAGIATQMLVERKLALEGKSRHDLGRAAFLDKVWEWKNQSGSTITSQLRRLGASPDWQRERFTLDEGVSAAVRRAFVTLFNDGLIYRDKRLVNWDPQLQTAVSDLEVISKEVKGWLWYIRYPLDSVAPSDYRAIADANGWNDSNSIMIATTRPETMLADGAVAVHPDNPRWQHLIGKTVVVPLCDRRIPVIADDYADIDKGTGAVKITAAHDFNDFKVAERHSLEVIVIMDKFARMMDNVPPAYRGLDRFDARKKVVADLEAAGLLVKTEAHNHMVPHGDRSGVVIEPYLTDQWYVRAEVLAKQAIKAVDDGNSRFVPNQWKNTWDEWLHNIQPWCISRQLWWGHQIPAWYGPDGHIFVAESQTEAEAQAARHYGRAVDLSQAQDPDVLDTWFSSALWPISTLGWPQQTVDLERFYPSTVMVTGFDIIFFWVARMMMFCIYFMNKDHPNRPLADVIPFRDIYIHALVRDASGQKMSKSKGNVLDPLETIDKYGADGLRFTLAAMAAPGRDVKISEQRIEGFRNFGTKLWNAAKFAEMNQCIYQPGFDPSAVTEPLNQWIVSETNRAISDSIQHYEGYRFDLAAQSLYSFVWDGFCDWYIELAKPILMGADSPAKSELQATFAWVLRTACQLLHPIMPFRTEQIFQLAGFGTGFLAVEPYPEVRSLDFDSGKVRQIAWLIATITEIRRTRAGLNVPASAVIKATCADNAIARELVAQFAATIARMARTEVAVGGQTASKGVTIRVTLSGRPQDGFVEYALDLVGVIDFAAEKQRLSKELAIHGGEVEKIKGRLGNPEFRAKADAEVITDNEARLKELTAMIEKIKITIEQIG